MIVFQFSLFEVRKLNIALNNYQQEVVSQYPWYRHSGNSEVNIGTSFNKDRNWPSSWPCIFLEMGSGRTKQQIYQEIKKKWLITEYFRTCALTKVVDHECKSWFTTMSSSCDPPRASWYDTIRLIISIHCQLHKTSASEFSILPPRIVALTNDPFSCWYDMS